MELVDIHGEDRQGLHTSRGSSVLAKALRSSWWRRFDSMSMRPASCILTSKEGIKNGQGTRHPNVFKCKWQPKRAQFKSRVKPTGPLMVRMRYWKNKKKEISLRDLPTGPLRWGIRTLGTATDWNFKAWILLRPLYKSLLFSFGRLIGRTVPSMKPKQFSSAAPLSWMTSAHCPIKRGFKMPLFNWVRRWWCSS